MFPTQWLFAQRLNIYFKAACKFGNITLAHDGPCKGKGKGKGEIYIPLQSCSLLSTDSDSGTEMKEGSGGVREGSGGVRDAQMMTIGGKKL